MKDKETNLEEIEDSHTLGGVVVHYNGENESYREEMRWCRCYEGQRDEA